MDKEAVAEHKQAAEAGLGGIIARLKSTGNPADAAKARALAEQGARGLDDADHNKIRALLDVKRRAKATHSGIDPFGTKFRDSNDPFDYEINQDDWKSGKEDIRLGPPVDPRNPNGPTRGGTIRRNHLRYNEPANVILPDWKIPTSRFDPAKGTLRQ